LPTKVSDFPYHEVEGQNWEHVIHFPLITRTTSTLPRFAINIELKSTKWRKRYTWNSMMNVNG
jgi:hypothetical protein